MAAASLGVRAQKVTFSSPGIEAGVRLHLGLDENTDILQSQMDTITAIDLSRLGITSLGDIVYLPNVQSLNLAENEITDLGPLNVLDSLRDLDLRDNGLESVNQLAFSNSTKMMVDVTSNFISDFSFLFDCFRCQLTLVGMGLQKVKDAPYLDVYQLYAEVNDNGRPVVCYRGYSNMGENARLDCGGVQTAVSMDGKTYHAEVPDNLTQTTKVCLTSNGEDGDSTWVIPSTVYNVTDGERKTIATGLPSTYRISSLRAQHGTVSLAGDDGLDIVYEAPAQAVDDTICLSYYEGSKLRGFVQLNIAASFYTLGDVNGDKSVTPSDAIMILYHYFGVEQSGFLVKAADLNGDGNISPADAIAALYLYFGAVNASRPAAATQEPQ